MQEKLFRCTIGYFDEVNGEMTWVNRTTTLKY